MKKCFKSSVSSRLSSISYYFHSWSTSITQRQTLTCTFLNKKKQKKLQTSCTEKCFNNHCSSLSSSFLSNFIRFKSTYVTLRQKLLIGHSNFNWRRTDRQIINVMHQCINSVWETQTQTVCHHKHFKQSTSLAPAVFFLVYCYVHIWCFFLEK